MLMVVFHQQKLQYWAQREYKYPQPPVGLQILGCLMLSFICFHYIYVFIYFIFSYYLLAYFTFMSAWLKNGS